LARWESGAVKTPADLSLGDKNSIAQRSKAAWDVGLPVLNMGSFGLNPGTFWAFLWAMVKSLCYSHHIQSELITKTLPSATGRGQNMYISMGLE
jgi:hypothetical protein